MAELKAKYRLNTYAQRNNQGTFKQLGACGIENRQRFAGEFTFDLKGPERAFVLIWRNETLVQIAAAQLPKN